MSTKLFVKMLALASTFNGFYFCFYMPATQVRHKDGLAPFAGGTSSIMSITFAVPTCALQAACSHHGFDHRGQSDARLRFGVRSWEVPTVACVLTTVALLATLVPARLAHRVALVAHRTDPSAN
jgi:hypothetical protein